MRFPVFILILALPSTASSQDAPAAHYAPLAVNGHIRDKRIVEASGLARSHLVPGRLWTINDGGSDPLLFAIGENGELHGSVRLRDGGNTDWEDLASFEENGKAWLIVADIGDNAAQRRSCTLYIVEEPLDLAVPSVRPERQVRFRYPDGSLDAESIAVDARNDSIFILVKRTVPARLYRVPLSADTSSEVAVAERLGDVASVPQPGNWEIVTALARKSWHWQPTGMDFSPDGDMAAILTYVGLYIYERSDNASWYETLQKAPQSVSLGDLRLAEAVAFGADGSLFVTAEGSIPPLFRSVRLDADSSQ